MTSIDISCCCLFYNSLLFNQEKLVQELDTLCRHLSRVVDRRDDKINRTQVGLIATAEHLTVKKENHLRWKMHTNIRNERERFFSIWFFADSSKLREMHVLVDSTPPEKVFELVNSPDVDFGLTPLHYAAKRESLDVVKYLLSKGASPAARSHQDGRTPLHFAAAYSTREILLELLASGADYYTADQLGCLALDLALQNKNRHTIDTLKRWPELNTTTLPPPTTYQIEQKSGGDTDISLSEKQLHRRRLLLQQQQQLTPSIIVDTDLYSDSGTRTALSASLSPLPSPSPYEKAMGMTRLSVAESNLIPTEFLPVSEQLRAKMDFSMSLLASRLDAHNKHLTPPSLLLTQSHRELLGTRTRDDIARVAALVNKGAISVDDVVMYVGFLGEMTVEDNLDDVIKELQVEMRLCCKFYEMLLQYKEGRSALSSREARQEARRCMQRRWACAKFLLPVLFLKSIQLRKHHRLKLAELARERRELLMMRGADSRAAEWKLERKQRKRMRAAWRRDEHLRLQEEIQRKREEREAKRAEQRRVELEEKAKLPVDLDKLLAKYKQDLDEQLTYVAHEDASVEEFSAVEYEKRLQEQKVEMQRNEMEEDDRDGDDSSISFSMGSGHSTMESSSLVDSSHHSVPLEGNPNNISLTFEDNMKMERDSLASFMSEATLVVSDSNSTQTNLTLSVVSGNQPDLHNDHPLLSVHNALSVGSELVEIYLQLHEEGAALAMLCECVHLCDVDFWTKATSHLAEKSHTMREQQGEGDRAEALITVRVDLFCRLCDVALFAFDYIHPRAEDEKAYQADVKARAEDQSMAASRALIASTLAAKSKAAKADRKRKERIAGIVTAIRVLLPEEQDEPREHSTIDLTKTTALMTEKISTEVDTVAFRTIQSVLDDGLETAIHHNHSFFSSSTFREEEVREKAANNTLFERFIFSGESVSGSFNPSGSYVLNRSPSFSDRLGLNRPSITTSGTMALQSLIDANTLTAADIPRDTLVGTGCRLLRAVLHWADTGIALLLKTYERDLAEPVTYAKLLECKAKAYERLRDNYYKPINKRDEDEAERYHIGRQAIECMQQAEAAACRLLGSSHENSIRVKLDVLRLYIKYVEKPTAPKVQIIGRRKTLLREHKTQPLSAAMAADINRNITLFSQQDILKADIFAQRCAELLALSTVGKLA